MLSGKITVPDHWKSGPPYYGMYHQAPPEWGGEWWPVNPFYGERPWERLWRGGVGPTLPEGFLEVFGERPRDPTLLSRWQQDLSQFIKAGPPDWISPEELDNISRTTVAWGMGEPKYYEGRYGYSVRFPNSGVSVFEWPARGLQTALHIAIASFQIVQLEEGIVPAQRHPFVPSEFFPKDPQE